MFVGYNLEIDDKENLFKDYVEKGKTHVKNQKRIVESSLEKYLNGDVLDGTGIGDDWFPEIEADIFISHSHANVDLANGLAGWLHEKFNLKCFIDSNVWGYADNLLEMINEEYSDKRPSENNGCIYSHEKCNTASKHVNTLLNIALHKMIDKCETTILINTNESIPKYSEVYKESTHSPWLYSEIVCTQLIRRKRLLEYRSKIQKRRTVLLEYNDYNVEYEVSTDHLFDLTMDNLESWKKFFLNNSKEYPLDILYKITKVDEIK